MGTGLVVTPLAYISCMSDCLHRRGRLVARAHRGEWTSRIQRVHTVAFAERRGFSGCPGLFEADWQRALYGDGYTLAVVEQGQRLVGYALGRPSHQATLPAKVSLDHSLTPEWLGTSWWLLWIGVDPKAQGHQIGTELLDLVLRDVSHAALYVDDDNNGAQHFYRASGWYPVGHAGSQQVWIFDRRHVGDRPLRPARPP